MPYARSILGHIGAYIRQHHIGLLALFIVLGGSSFAAVSGFPRADGTIRACVAKKGGAVRFVKSGKRCRRSETTLALNQKGAAGLRGAQGAAGANGAPGAAGQNGRDFDANSVLPSGQTLTGVWALGGGAVGSHVIAIPFTPRLAADIPAGKATRTTDGVPTAQCPGPGQAAAGSFCLYERVSTSTFQAIGNPVTGALNSADRRGIQVSYSAGAGNQSAVGTWAVTAP